VFSTSQSIILLLLALASLLVQVFALIDAAIRPAHAYLAENKLKKPIWLLILLVAALLTFAILRSFYALFLVAPALVYLADVRPRLQPYTRRKGGGGSGPSRPSSGGW